MMGITLVSVSESDALRQEIESTASKGFGHGEALICASAIDARRSIEENAIDVVWVFSADDMGPVNLAASLAKNSPSAQVYSAGQISDDACRQIQEATGIKGFFDPEALFERFRANARKDSCEEELFESEEPKEADGSTNFEKAEGPFGPSVLERPIGLGSLCAPTKPKTKGSAEKSEKHISAEGKKAASVITVLSGSGGVGKSSTVATASYLAASKGYSVAVIDCDLQFGDMRQLMGGVPCTSIDDVLMDASIFQAFARSCNKDIPSLICAPSRLERSEELSEHVEELLDLCASAFDVVLVNTGSSWSEVNAQLIEKSNCNIFMVDQRASSVRSCQHAVELCMRMGLATGQFVYALNRCTRGSLFCAPDISSAMQGGIAVELKDGGPEVEELLGMGLVGELAASKNDFTNSLNILLEEVLP